MSRRLKYLVFCFIEFKQLFIVKFHHSVKSSNCFAPTIYYLFFYNFTFSQVVRQFHVFSRYFFIINTLFSFSCFNFFFFCYPQVRSFIFIWETNLPKHCLRVDATIGAMLLSYFNEGDPLLILVFSCCPICLRSQNPSYRGHASA